MVSQEGSQYWEPEFSTVLWIVVLRTVLIFSLTPYHRMLVSDLLGNVGAYPLEGISDKTSNGWETKSDALQLEYIRAFLRF